MNTENVQLTVNEITDIIADVLGKGEDTIMMDVEKSEALYW